MKRIVKIIIILVALLITLMSLAFSYYIFQLSPVSKNKTLKEVTISSNTTIGQIAILLKDKKIIRDDMTFKIYTRLHNLTNLKSGIYKLSENMGVEKVVNILYEGKGSQIGEINILFKEGKTMRSIAKTIADKTNNTEEDVFNLLKNQTYINNLIKQYWFLTDEIKNVNIYYPIEGYLAPDTYRFTNKNVKVEDIFKRMLDQADSILTKYKSDITKKDLTIHQFLTMASLVESEGVNIGDRPKIAGVFYNRLQKKMSFGSCVTVFYALKEDMSTRKLLQRELDIVNPYNTYPSNMAGKLPVGPVSNPGEESIKATLNPDYEYLYFLSDKNGKTYFSKTLTEHNAKIKELDEKGLW